MSAEIAKIPVDTPTQSRRKPSLYTPQIITLERQLMQSPESGARTIVAQQLIIDRLRREIADDHLTGLKNRRWFESDMKEKIAQANRNNSSLWLLFMDIDDFKQTNTQYGHPVGDIILQQITHLSREGEPIARLGGEEFGQLFTEDLTPDAIAAINERYQNRMGQLSEEVLAVANALHTYSPEELLRKNSLSIGITKYVPGEEAKSLYERANKAMHEAKKRGKKQIVVSDSV